MNLNFILSCFNLLERYVTITGDVGDDVVTVKNDISMATVTGFTNLFLFVLYGVPFPPKFNVSFYIPLFAFYPTFVAWYLFLHFRYSTFVLQHTGFCLVHSIFRRRYSSSRSGSAGCTFKFLPLTMSICHLSFCYQNSTLCIPLASLHCTFNFLNSTFIRWASTAGHRWTSWAQLRFTFPLGELKVVLVSFWSLHVVLIQQNIHFFTKC